MDYGDVYKRKMMNKLNKKILFIIGNLRVSNGVTSVIMNHYNKLIKAGYEVDFCAMYNWGSPYIKTVLNNGGNFYILPQEDVKDEVETSGIRIEEDRSGKPDKKRAYDFVKKIIENGNYGIVHIHIIGYYALIASQIAKKCNVPIRIFHSHNPIHIHNLHSLLFTLFYNVQCVHNCNRYLACSNLAGKSMFGHRKFYVIRNTIDTNLIYYSEQKRNELRKELSIKENDFVYGTVCRQTYQKNPYFLIDVFEQIALRKENAKFVWAGTGELEIRIKQYAKSKKLGSKILFIGNRDDMAGVYSMMDCFILPSRYEGLGIVFVEAQACGVPVYASDVVPKDVMITRLMHYISLKKTAAEWAEIIVKDNSVYEERSVYKQKIIDAKYDRSNNNDLLEYYESLT